MVDGVGHAYGELAELYIEMFGTTGQVHADDLAFIAAHLSTRPGVVLDVGCGPGHLADYLRSMGVATAGVDLVPAFIEHARSAHPGGSYMLGSMERLPFADRSVTGVLAWYSLIHLPPEELNGVLAEFRRVMVPGGTLVIGLFDGDEVAPFEHKVAPAWFWPPDEFTTRLRRAGFTEVARSRRPAQIGQRPHAAIAAIAAIAATL